MPKSPLATNTSTRVFAYCRVSTGDQTTENQLIEIEQAGFQGIGPRRVVAETVSGSVSAMQREGFASLVSKLEGGDVLVVTRMDRLGRNVSDVLNTVEMLGGLGVRVHCIQLGGMDLTSSTGKLTMGILAHVAAFERELLVERTQAGLTRAKAEGKTLGRKPVTKVWNQQAAIIKALEAGQSVSAVSKDYGTSRATILRVKAAAAPAGELPMKKRAARK